MKNFNYKRSIVAAIGTIPLTIRQYIGTLCGTLFALIPLREKKIAQAQLKFIFKSNSNFKIIAKMYANFGRIILESFNLSTLIKHHISFEDPAFFQQLLATNSRPVVALTAHFGNWELLAAYVIANGGPLLSIGRPARSTFAHEILEEIRHKHNIRMVWRDDTSSAKEIVKALRSGQWVGTLIDQDTQVASMPIPFFGREAQTPNSIINLGNRYNAIFVSAFAYRDTNKNYKIRATRLPESNDPGIILSAYNKQLESIIKEYPEQWVWFHKRWRTTKDGHRLSTKEYLQTLQQT